MRIELKLNSKFLIVFFVIVLSIMLIARDVFTIPMNKFVYLGICALFLVVSDSSTRIKLVSFLLPLMCGIPSTYVLLLIMVLYIIEKKIKKETFLLCAFFTALEIIGLSYVNMPLSGTVVGQILFVCTFFTMMYTTEDVDYLQCMKMYLLGNVLLSLVIDTYTIIRAPANWLTYFAQGWYRFGTEGLEGIESMTLRLNPISLGLFCTSGVLIGVVLLVRTKGFERLWVYTEIGILTITAILAVSRAFILVIAGCLALIAFYNIREIRHLKNIAITIFLMGIMGTIVYAVYPQLFTAMIIRLTDSSMEGGNGRVELMIEYAAALLSDSRRMLVGTGAAYSRIAIGAEFSIHNAIIQIMISYGVWGGIIYLIAMAFPLLREKKEEKAEFIYWIPVIGTFVYMQTIQFLNPCYLMMPYVMAVYAVKAGRQKNATASLI